VTLPLEPNHDFNLAGVTDSMAILEDKLMKAYTDVIDHFQIRKGSIRIKV
jgi:hypothetical protein